MRVTIIHRKDQFLSEDPVFLAIGDLNKVGQLTNKQQDRLLTDPQAQNPYGYARDNPVVNKDATGLISEGEIEAVYKLLYLNSGRETVNSGIDAFFEPPGQSAQEHASAQAQFNYDFGTFSVTTAAIYGLNLSGTGAVIDAGNIVLAGVDKYCSGHVCKDLSQSQNVTAAQILNGIPTGKMADYTLSNKPSSYGSNGAPIWGVRSSTPQTSGNAKSNGAGSNGGGPSQLINLYQSLISVLNAYIGALSTPTNARH
jgi:hypothetical protein